MYKTHKKMWKYGGGNKVWVLLLHERILNICEDNEEYGLFFEQVFHTEETGLL